MKRKTSIREATMTIHFEELWEEAEKFHSKNQTTGDPIEELLLKVRLYQMLETKELPADEKIQAQNRTMGEILLTLTALSNKDQINTFEALATALQYRTIKVLDQKHPLLG
jgi:hypothetical protein